MMKYMNFNRLSDITRINQHEIHAKVEGKYEAVYKLEIGSGFNACLNIWVDGQTMQYNCHITEIDKRFWNDLHTAAYNNTKTEDKRLAMVNLMMEAE